MLPWQNTTAHNEREAFIAVWQEGKETVASLAHHFGVSRKTAHKFINRFRAAGTEGLLDRSRAPRAPHNATPQEVVDLLIQAKRADAAFGPKKLVPLLRAAYPHLRWPAPSTAGAILDRAGLVRRRKRRRRTAPWHDPFQQAVHPNDCWCTDFKGWVRTGDGVRIDPLTIQDARSRYLLACQALLRPAFHEVRPVFERTFREYGLPLVIRSDNGPPFASTALGGLTQLASGSSSSASSRSASSRDTPNRTAASSGSTAPCTRRPSTPSGPPRPGSSGSSTPTCTGTTTSGRTRPWARRPRRPTTVLRPDPIPARSRARSTTPASSSAVSGPMARSSGAAVSST